MGEQTLAEKAEMFSQLGKLPLAKNPFFIKSIANSGQFEGEGTEGMTPGTSEKSKPTGKYHLPTGSWLSIILKKKVFFQM